MASTAIARAGVAGLTLAGTFVAAHLAIAPAFADGGQGGAPAFGGAGGAGGTATAPNGGNGSDEDLITVFGGGGGGGGGVSLATGGGGNGGTGGTIQTGSGDSVGGNGGNGGNFGLIIPAAPNAVPISGMVGGAGGSAAIGGGGGGGGGEGGGGVLFTGLAASSNASTITGGNGGAGGDTANSLFASGSAGSGGAGGIGVALTFGANFTNNAGATVQGGGGGAGGAAGFSVNDIAGNGGNGGNGGAGVLMVNGGTLTNAGTITGGAAGAGGSGGAGLVNGANGVSGVGGTGVSGANITVVNSGTIAGGSGGGLAIAFIGGTNTLVLQAGSTISGNVVAFSSADTLRLGGSTNATFDVSTMGAAAQYRGFGIFAKAGTSTWTLTGTNSFTGTTLVSGGTLLAGNAGAFSATSAMTINGGTVDLGATAQTINNVALAGGALKNGSLAGTVTSTGGGIGGVGGSMSLVANGGTTTVTGPNTYTGATTVNNGALLFTPIDNAFSAASAVTINSGGTFLLSGSQQTINTVSLAGGTLESGILIGAVTSIGGALNDMFGSMSLTANGGTTTVGGFNSGYTGVTTVNNGAILLGGIANGFSAVSATTINTGGTVDLGSFAQTINNVALAGGLLTNGLLTGAVTSTGGTIAGLGGSMSLTTTGGSTTVTGTNTYTGLTTVNGGLLSVNGSIVSDVTVNAGGTLGGNGTVGNTTINGGALAPGNSIGLLTVQGSLTFTAAASYMVEVSPVSADRTNVTGAATLGDATVIASFAPGTYVAKQYTIVNASSGVHGKFSALVNTDLPSGFTASLSYDNDDAYLNLALSFVPPTGLNANQQNVGNALVNFFNSTGGIPIVFGALTPAGLTQLSGEAGTGSQQTTFNAMNQFMGVMTDPFVAGRGDGLPAVGTAAGYTGEEALAYAQKRQPRDALAAITTKAPSIVPSFQQRWSVWAAGFGGSQTTDGNVALGSNNTTSSIYGTAVGADYRVSPDTLVGFALAGGGTNFAVANNLGGGRSDLFQAGAFVRHNAGATYLTAALAYGWQDITTDRTVTVAGIDRLRAEFKANAWSGRLEGGYRFVSHGFGLTPYAAGQFTTFDLPAYAEAAIAGSNIFALAYTSKSVTDTRSELGLRSDKPFALHDGVLTLRGRAAWAHDFNPDRSLGATFQTLPGASFVVSGAAQASDSALVTGAVEMKWLNGWTTAATFEGEFSNVTRSYAGKGVARYQW
ncbi:autotransporter domain-containing protein [Frankia sp. RB7]|nr:autotransporter domain-containing protein [Frankia sp. RB7]